MSFRFYDTDLRKKLIIFRLTFLIVSLKPVRDYLPQLKNWNVIQYFCSAEMIFFSFVKIGENLISSILRELAENLNFFLIFNSGLKRVFVLEENTVTPVEYKFSFFTFGKPTKEWKKNPFSNKESWHYIGKPCRHIFSSIYTKMFFLTWCFFYFI